MMHNVQYGFDRCPVCGADWNGGMVPVERQALLHARNYTRAKLGFYGDQEGMIDYLKCPDCNQETLL